MLTIEIMKAQLGALQAGLKAESLQGFLSHSERWFRDEVGTDLYAWLKSLNPVPPEAAELLRLAHSCLAWQAYSLAFPHQKFRVSELGMMKTSPQSSVAVTKWEYIDSKDANLSMLDLSLEYLWREVEHLKPAAWTGSPAYAERNRHFIRSAAELGSLLPIAGRNYRFFEKIVPHIDDVEEEQIQATLTPGVYNTLKQKWQNSSLTLTYQEDKLITLARKATAHLAVYAAWPYLPLTVDDLGIAETRSKDGLNEGVAPGGNLRQAMRQQLYADGQKHLAKVAAFLDANASPTAFVDYYLKYLAPGTITLPPDDFTDKPHVIL